MQTQVTCPHCRTPFATEVTQIVDVGQHPELKSLLLNGQLNLAVCPNCATAAQLALPMLYHEPEHKLFMVYVPMELNLPHVEQERLIGNLVRQVIDRLPANERRAYMLQPQTIINLQTFLEKVLETEGITPEMLARQRRQVELLETMSRATPEQVDQLIEQKAGELDEDFFVILQSALQGALGSNDDRLVVNLTNLQATLYRRTPVGQELERRNLALSKLQRDAKKRGQLSARMLVDHVVSHEMDEGIVDALGKAAVAFLSYEFFAMLTDLSERRAKKGDADGARRIAGHRDHLLQVREKRDARLKAQVAATTSLLRTLLDAPDQKEAVRQNLFALDEQFLGMLQMAAREAEKRGDQAEQEKFKRLDAALAAVFDEQLAPEMRLLQQLMDDASDNSRRELLDSRPDLVNENMLEWIQVATAAARENGDKSAELQLARVEAMVRARLLAGNG